jgi:hypothetical protein
MGTTRATILGLSIVVIGVLGALAGCTGVPSAGPTTRAATTAASATPTASATPSSAAAPATCENLIDAATLEGFSTSGLHITPPIEFAGKMRDENNALSGFADAGGVVCQVGGDYNATEIYGWSPYVATVATALQQQLVDQGWVPTSVSGGLLYSLPPNSDDVMNRCFVSVTEMSCAFGDARLAEVRENAPS